MATFKNVAPHSITLSPHALPGVVDKPIVVESGATFEVADEYAYAPKLIGLPVEEFVITAPIEAPPKPERRAAAPEVRKPVPTRPDTDGNPSS